jgi:Holliday junction DNA helicase RuvA
VGKKLAERLVVELKEKATTLRLPQQAAPPIPATAEDRAVDDVVSALVNLGCNRKEALKAAEAARQELGPSAEFETLIKTALRGIGEQR